MCGIVAVITRSNLAPEVLDRMRDRLAHRGPDGARSWITNSPSGTVGLGHRRLRIIDLSDAAAQPMFSDDGKLVITYNGEIYNYLELRSELKTHGVQFKTQSDTEVLLQAYAVWGTECLERLNGMFAFIIWDAAARHAFVARDRFGEKPLFYTEFPDDGIALASEMKALFAHPDVDPVIDEEALHQFSLGRPLIIGTRTLFKDIHRLPQASAMLIDASGRIAKSWRYWTPDFNVAQPYRPREAAAHFRELLSDSVRLRLRSDVPLGTCLSGGLDSSVLTGMTAQLNDDRRYHGKTYSVRFDDDPTISEGQYIDLMNMALRAQPRSVQPTPRMLMEESQRMHWHQEDPVYSASMYLEWCLMRLVRTNDDVVVLNGQGADELLAGYARDFLQMRFDWLSRGHRLRFAVETCMAALRYYRESFRYRDSERRLANHLQRDLQWLLEEWRIGRDPDEPQHPGLPSSKGGHTFRYARAHGLLYSTLQEQLNSADRNAMAFGVETRFPFLDYRLIDWCIGLPEEALIRNGWQKYILRRAAKGLIPRSIQWRVDKVGFAAPFDAWLRGELKDWANDRIFSGPATQLPFYDRAKLEQAWEQFQSGASRQTWLLWRWLSINEWLNLTTSGAWKSDAVQRPSPVKAVGSESVAQLAHVTLNVTPLELKGGASR